MKTTKYMQTPIRIAFVAASWHADIVKQSRAGFLDEITSVGEGVADVHLFNVPGAYDIPLMAQELARTGNYDAIVAAGFVVDGGIYRHDFVAGTVIEALMRVQLDTGVPVISAVLTPHQFQETEPHIAFFKRHFVVKGAEAARAVMQITDNMRSLPIRQSPVESAAYAV